MPLFRPLGTLVVLALLGACTQHLPPDEPQPPGVADSGTTDSGTSDSGTRTDGGTKTDGGTTDGGTTDGGVALSFSLGNWNVEWFGDTTNGPTDEAKQLDNVQVVIANADLDFWGLQEIVDPTAFNTLKQRLPGYAGFLADDSSISSGSYYYAPTEQKVGILYRTDVVTVKSAQLILTSDDSYFAGRPPLRVDLRLTRDGSSVDLVAIVLHMKALDDRPSYDRRKNAALLLKSYLDTQLANEHVVVLGDWNDDVDFSIVWDSTSSSYLPTPYQNFLDDAADYTFGTRPLSLANQRSTVRYPDFIDHQLYSNELAANHVSGSAQVLKPTLTQYGTTTSDHYPVLSRFAFTEQPPPPPPPPASPVFINEFLPIPYNVSGTTMPDWDQQFVEVFNSGSEAVDLSGWRLNDDKSYAGLEPTRHVFPTGTLLAPGKAYVVYAGRSAFSPGTPNTASTSGGMGFRFNRGKNEGSSGDAVYLQRADGTVVDSHRYDSTFPGISYNSSPDLSRMAPFVRHDVLVPGTVSSPGLQATGSAF
jgi:endonuclease/exonuclease/phosphatase family metal-dependent hydrolase